MSDSRACLRAPATLEDLRQVGVDLFEGQARAKASCMEHSVS